jgi:hypothetical protein
MPSAHTFSIAQAEFGFRGEEVHVEGPLAGAPLDA